MVGAIRGHVKQALCLFGQRNPCIISAMTLPQYEILALRYATMQNRTKAENFLFPDDHHAVMPIDYYVWVIRGEGR